MTVPPNTPAQGASFRAPCVTSRLAHSSSRASRAFYVAKLRRFEGLYSQAMASFAKAENHMIRESLNDGDKRRQAHSDVAGRLRPLIGTGITQAEAAKMLNCSASSVCQALKKMGVKL